MSVVLGYLILAMVGLGLIGVIFRPQFALVLVVSLYPLKQLIGSYLPVFVQNSAAFNVMVFAAVLLAVLSRIAKRQRPTAGLLNWLTAITVFLYLYATLAIAWSPGNGAHRWMDGYAYWAMNVVLLPLTLITIEDFRKSLVPLLLVGVIVAVLFYTNPNASWYSGRFTIYIAGRNTVSEIRGNPLAVGQMGGVVAVAAALMLPVRGGPVVNLLRIAAILTGLGLALTSGSRAQAVLAVLAIVLFYPMARRIKNVRQFFLTAGGLAAVMGVIAVGLRLFLGQTREQTQRWDVANWSQTISDRIGDAMLLIREYANSPQAWLQGLGTNAFSAVSGWPISYAHNAPVEMLCELGLIGLTLYCLAMYLAFRAGRRLFRANADDTWNRATVATLLGLCFYSFTLSLKQYTFVAMPEPWWLLVILAKLATHDQELHRHAENAAWHSGEYYDPEDAAEPDSEAVPT